MMWVGGRVEGGAWGCGVNCDGEIGPEAMTLGHFDPGRHKPSRSRMSAHSILLQLPNCESEWSSSAIWMLPEEYRKLR